MRHKQRSIWSGNFRHDSYCQNLAAVLEVDRDNNIPFADLQRHLGFRHRVKGSHFIYWREGIDEIINIKPEAGKAKAYQVKQVRSIIYKYGLH